MSSFVVGQDTINHVVGFLTSRAGEYAIGGFERATGLDRHEPQKIGEALLKMNIAAVGQRYNEEQQAGLVETYRHTYGQASLVQKFKSAQCLRYQCTEGDVPETALYKALDRLVEQIASAIISGMPEYEKAKWGN